MEKEIQFPGKGYKTEFQVIGDTPRDVFTLHIYRGTKNNKKYDFGARVKICDKPLLELHINPGAAHINPDGKKITGSHWHIYTEKYGRDLAFPAENIQSDKFVENTILFLERFNVVQKPNVQLQLEF
ncbi:MAG TPA: hypothetical protein DEP23_00540 [Ruminococcaceae bacterium]|nr:hypothetical protein [Oscillospiraceae bacterium]